ncbi:mechanosensitive ion channel family protein [Jiangella alkaliphila]|uniref:Small conductance mechanosensitive channel n=1 Tax=Jiangella alkaliphila TaxID=419479 RepID=A0A1H2LMN4_9ACTN|nr:mechanosensitive ion channel family protein [Jiangella alkaliphila]SDU82267.1 small conductance mechanosensitive channel [Jiangella alkaliphila]
MAGLLAAGGVTEAEQYSGEWWRDILLDVPLRLAGLVLIAVVTRYLLHKFINRLVRRTVEKEPPKAVLGSARAARIVFGGAGAYSERRSLRAETLGSVLRSISTVLISVITVVMALEILGYSVGPVLASAGVAGVALGFGAQNLVKDFLAGAAMLLEDQYGVGDVVDMGHAVGTVEAVSLRITRLRSVDGTVWYVRNGEVVRVGNSSYGWSRVLLDVHIPADAEVTRARRLLEDVVADLAADDRWGELILEPPEVWGVEDLTPDGVLIRVVIKTKPLEQWGVARELRERIKSRFDAERLTLPVATETPAAGPGGPGGATNPPPASAPAPPIIPPSTSSDGG